MKLVYSFNDLMSALGLGVAVDYMARTGGVCCVDTY